MLVSFLVFSGMQAKPTRIFWYWTETSSTTSRSSLVHRWHILGLKIDVPILLFSYRLGKRKETFRILSFFPSVSHAFCSCLSFLLLFWEVFAKSLLSSVNWAEWRYWTTQENYGKFNLMRLALWFGQFIHNFVYTAVGSIVKCGLYHFRISQGEAILTWTI